MHPTFQISLYVKLIVYLSELNTHRVVVPLALHLVMFTISGCTAPAPLPPNNLPMVQSVSCDVYLEPQLLELRRENLILSAELRYQYQISRKLQQGIDVAQHPAEKPTTLEQLKSGAAEQPDSPIFILGKQLVFPFAIYTALRAVSELIKP